MESKATYGIGGVVVNPSTLTRFVDGWEHPTPDDIRAAMNMAGLNAGQLAALVGASGGNRVVRFWLSEKSKMPYASWAILANAAGLGEIWK